MDLPGGPEFQDVTDLFLTASEEMHEGDMFMTQGFTLNEAMSAIEIGDPRMDSGVALPSESQATSFDPLLPLLPVEVCWILDRIFSCEMQWHAGNTLMQTVHSCLYMHHLQSISPDYLKAKAPAHSYDASRPLQLISVVVRAGVLGMLKCCDLAYRELNKANVHDGEDWQGEKADVTLCEGTPAQRVLQILEEAEAWLNCNETRDLPHRVELLARTSLRRALLRIYMLELPRKTASMTPLLREMRGYLDLITGPPNGTRSSGSNSLYARSSFSPLELEESEDATMACYIRPPSPARHSAARSAFDPQITRKLHSFIPLRPLALPTRVQTWEALYGLQEGWEELVKMSSCESLLAWTTMSDVRASMRNVRHKRIPYLRSAVQTIFSDGTTVLDRFPYLWLVDRFFTEIIHVPLNRISALFQIANMGSYTALPSYSWDDLQRDLAKLLMQHVWAAYHNRPRHRRHLMKTNVEWHAVFDSSLSLIANARVSDPTVLATLQLIPLAILHWRALSIREIVLSGLELELYSADELPFVYWYLVQVSTKHRQILERLIGSVQSGSPAQRYLRTQIETAHIWRSSCEGFFLTLVRKSPLNPMQRCANFVVRYKWALGEAFENIRSADIFFPDFQTYMKREKEALSGDRAADSSKAAKCFDNVLVSMSTFRDLMQGDPSLKMCLADYSKETVSAVSNACLEATRIINSVEVGLWPVAESKQVKIVWNRDRCPWFPYFERRPENGL